MSADSRTPHTDALATLGTKIDPSKEGRDAIHLAVEPAVAGTKLYPGQDVGFLRDGSGRLGCGPGVVLVGIVDPVLKEPVYDGDGFWLVIYPRQITSLRHVWQHPLIPETQTTPAPEVVLQKPEPKIEPRRSAILDSLALELEISYEDLLQGFYDYLDYGKDLVGGDSFVSPMIEDRHWDAFEEVSGRKVPNKFRENFLDCSC